VDIPTSTPSVRQLAVDEASDGQRLDNFLLKVLKGVPKSHVYRVIRSGEVRVNRSRASAERRLAIGDLVRVPPVRVAAPDDPSDAPPRHFATVHEDDGLLVIDKPAGVAVHGGSGVSFGVIEQLRAARPEARFLELVHRLDRETSGLLLIAKKRSVLTALQDALRDHRQADAVRKTYRAVVWGAWPASLKVIDQALHKGSDAAGERFVRVVPADREGALRAITLVRVLRVVQQHAVGEQALSELAVTLKTGRTHQIRVHLAHTGHAIVGDPKYGDFARNRQMARGEWLPGGLKMERMALHAQGLSFVHPSTGERMELSSPLPAEWQRLMAA
jgi:23S rRNA pseudouridine955/2504/2580 synthase